MAEDELLAYLKQRHTGFRRAVSSHALEARFHIRGRELREWVNALRGGGHPVCSGGNGYFYAETEQELSDTIRQLQSRINRIAGARNGLARAYEKYAQTGQLTIPLLSEGDNIGGTGPPYEVHCERSEPAFSAENARTQGGEDPSTAL